VKRLLSFSRARAGRGQGGWTLVEMLVAMSLFSVVSAAAFGAVIVMQNQAVTTQNRFTAQGEAQTIAERITKDLRTAVAPTTTTAAFASADANDVVFYANLSDLNAVSPKGPTRLHAYVSKISGTDVYAFHEEYTIADSTSTPGNYTYNDNAPVNRIDGQYLDTSQPIFSYYDVDGNLLTAPITTMAGLRSIDAVGVTLHVRVHPNSPSVVVTSRIHVRNVDYNPDN
jgi:prepilin-type N-terminal cleavage/methylation domain-containing protein